MKKIDNRYTDACPDRDRLHTKDSTEPTGYVAWHGWAAWMVAHRSRTKKCPTCGSWAIWSPTGAELGYDSSRDPVCIVGGQKRRVVRNDGGNNDDR